MKIGAPFRRIDGHRPALAQPRKSTSDVAAAKRPAPTPSACNRSSKSWPLGKVTKRSEWPGVNMGSTVAGPSGGPRAGRVAVETQDWLDGHRPQRLNLILG